MADALPPGAPSPDAPLPDAARPDTARPEAARPDAPLPSTGEDAVRAPAVPGPARPLTGQGPALGVIAVGGAIGALARYGVGLALPHAPGTFPLATFLINVVGGLLIGVLIVVITEWTQAHPLVRPFLVTGILGGFTTFSTYATDSQQLILDGHLGTAAAYLAGTLLAAVAATWLGIRLARAAGGLRSPRPAGAR